ncbi:predicted protein [Uncinocarpus reesii 1704]|uniref:Uncharacterized protein n=1 Tax=Uncinocarpus reesii (strain UAMH 1704) TaxID=336963 RepID=C4JJQ3_UNCRE|nr:uncharacterized protein UREG_01860 [Uncinocarpus reesii 1704]EEP77011.1 predicted protein [Uncinocarpus reesii 1704]
MDRDKWTSLLTPKSFGQRLRENFGIQSTQCHRVTEFWRENWHKYVKTAYGQAIFNFPAADETVGTKLEEPWKVVFDQHSSETFITRCPGFLVSLSDDEYVLVNPELPKLRTGLRG